MNKVKQFIIDNSPEFAEAVEQGYSIIMREDEILEWMQRYADNEVKNLALTQVSKWVKPVQEDSVCPICHGLGYYTYGGSFGGQTMTRQCSCGQADR